MKRAEGYITVFFSMILLSVIAVVFAALENVRINAVRMRAEGACAISAEAFLSQYHPSVQARYGLYMVERDGFDDAFLKAFVEKNSGSSTVKNSVSWLQSEVTGVIISDGIFISQDNFVYLEKQITDYMKILKGNEYAQEFIKNMVGFDGENLESKKDSLDEQLNQHGEMAESNEAEKPDNSHSSDGFKDPRNNISQLLRNPILTLIMDDAISNKSINKNSLSKVVAEEQKTTQIKGFLNYKDVTENMKDIDLSFLNFIESKSGDLMADAYIMEFLRHATGNASSQEKSVNALQYEVEYILSGNASDYKNLESTINKIIVIRMLLNLAYLYKNPSKTAAVNSLSTMLAATVLMPFLQQVINLLILSAWAYGEAIIDCKNLIRGHKVPLMKNDSNWNLSLESLGKLTKSSLKTNAAQGQNNDGLGYEDYLHLLLLSVSKEKKYTRLLNIIEVNTQLEKGFEKFSIDKCVFGITMTADFEFPPVFIANPFSGGNYIHHVQKSAAY